MKLRITVRSSDPNVITEIAHAKIEGVTIKEQLTISEIENPPIDFILEIVKTVVLSVTAQLIARMLYDKLKGRKDNQLAIQNQFVEINPIKIERLVINELRGEDKNEKTRSSRICDA